MNCPASSQKYGRCDEPEVCGDQERREQQVHEDVAAGTDRAGGAGADPGAARRNHCTMPPGVCGSSLISPNAVSYWVTFCLQNVEQRLGLLRADVNRLKIVNHDIFRRGLVHAAEQQQESPRDSRAPGRCWHSSPGTRAC